MYSASFCEILGETPIIAAVKSFSELEKSLTFEGKIIFVLFGDVLTIADIIARIKAAGKIAFVHIDLIEGLAAKDVSVDYLAKISDVDGIISTKSSLIRKAKTLGLLTIQRFFLLDSIALENIEKQSSLDCASAIEILPGVMPKVIKMLSAKTSKPIIASGLIRDKDDVMAALNAGAISVSCSNAKIWDL